MQLSDYAENLVIDHYLRGDAFTPPSTVYLALFTSATTDAGGGTEAAGGSYARKAITFAAPSAGATTSTAPVTFPNMPAGTYTHAAICDASSGGHFLWHGPLTSPKTALAGQQLEVAAGDIDVGFTSSSALTTYMRHAVLNSLLRDTPYTPTTLYLALFTTATTVAGAGTEVTGGSYARQAATLTLAAGGVTTNTGVLDHTGMPTATVVDAALMDAASGGNMLVWGGLTAPVGYTAADVARWPIGAYQLTVR